VCCFKLVVLQDGGVLHQTLVRHLESVDVKLAHVQNIPCPVHLYAKKVHVHSSNGVFVAVKEDVM